MVGAITFDFHDTLAKCDRWFELEIRYLAAALLRWHGEQSMNPPQPELVLEAESSYRRLRRAIIDHGDELPAEACVARVLADLGVVIAESEIAHGIEYLMRQALTEVSPIPGSIETVRALSLAGAPLGIISSAVYHPFLEWTLTRFGIRDAFSNITTSASAGYYKSRPELFHHAMSHLGATPECSVHIGDSYRFDVAGARRAGMKTVWFRPDPAKLAPGQDESAPPDLTLETLLGATEPILDLFRRC